VVSRIAVCLRCPSCGAWSLTFDWVRNGYICHVYGGFLPDERMNHTTAPIIT